LAEVYSVLHRFSVGNQILAVIQADQRNLAIGPVATYKGWQRVGRQVRRGEKAISLLRPINHTIRETNKETGEETNRTFVSFVLRPYWFLLTQTDGDDYSEPAPVGDWDWRRACEVLGVVKAAYETTEPALGCATGGGTIAVAPWNPHPLATICHELAHIALGHTANPDGAPRAIQEIQAESVAYLVGATIGFGDGQDSRGYIQWWAERGGVNGIDDLTEAQVRAIFSAAEKVRQAGLPSENHEAKPDLAEAA
jgi:antirestriction protein ArdC